MTALADMLSARDRERLAARMLELAETERIVTERGRQRPPPAPRPLHQAATQPTERTPCTTRS